MMEPTAVELKLFSVAFAQAAEALAELINTGHCAPDCPKAIDDSECTCGRNEAVVNALPVAIAIRTCRDILKDLCGTKAI
jgi:hypothetical protein